MMRLPLLESGVVAFWLCQWNVLSSIQWSRYLWSSDLPCLSKVISSTRNRYWLSPDSTADGSNRQKTGWLTVKIAVCARLASAISYENRSFCVRMPCGVGVSGLPYLAAHRTGHHRLE
jgi:hypothetical protein